MQGTVKLEGLDGVYGMLMSLPKELVSKRGGPVRAALRKGAVVIQKKAIQKLNVVTSNATEEGKRVSTGLLAQNVVVTRGKAPLSGNGERYLVRVRRKSYNRAAERKAEGKRAKRSVAVTTPQTARLLEYGSSKQPAEPWLRPAFQETAVEAIRAVETELAKGVDRIAQRLLKQGRA